MLVTILKYMHLIAGIVWVGSVFMGAFIDWPSAKKSMPKGKFPFKFIIGQGTGVFYSVYMGIFFLWISGVGLIYFNPLETLLQKLLIGLKIFCLLIMTLFTLYGTFFTWPKLQLSNDEESFILYKNYIRRAMITFVCGILASILGKTLILN
jgi:uncharacterized membrane protein